MQTSNLFKGKNLHTHDIMKWIREGSTLRIILTFHFVLWFGLVTGFIVAVLLLNESDHSINPYKEISQCMRRKMFMPGEFFQQLVYVPLLGHFTISQLSSLLSCCLDRADRVWIEVPEE